MIYQVEIWKNSWKVTAMTHWNEDEHSHICNKVFEMPGDMSLYCYIPINIGSHYPERFSPSALAQGLALINDELGKVRI